jgi:hypothetical protein
MPSICSTEFLTTIHPFSFFASNPSRQPQQGTRSRHADHTLRRREGKLFPRDSHLCNIVSDVFDILCIQIENHLPGHIQVVQASGHPVAWVCDPMHGKCALFPPSSSSPRLTGLGSNLQHTRIWNGCQDTPFRDDNQRTDVLYQYPHHLWFPPGRCQPRIHGRTQRRRIQRHRVSRW